MTDGDRIQSALEARDVEAIAALANEGVDLNAPLVATDAGPRSLLDAVLRLGDAGFVRAVLALPGVSVHRSLPEHARWSWAQHAPLPVVQAFVEHSGMGAGMPDADGRTLLHEVATGGADPEVMAWLVGQAGVDADAVAIDGATPFFHAAVNGRGRRAAELLHAAGADPNPASTYTGWTPLVVAIAEGDDGTVEWLLQLDGVDVNRPDLDGTTPLHHAMQLGRARAAEALRAAGAVDVAGSPEQRPQPQPAEGSQELTPIADPPDEMA